MFKKRSIWDRLTGGVQDEEEYEEPKKSFSEGNNGGRREKKNNDWIEEENEEAELAVDVYQTGTEIIIQTFVAGVKPEDLELSIARDIITIVGKREEHRNIDEGDYFTKELYWGRFSRTLTLPQEVEPEEVEATEKHGLVTIRIKKVDKEKTNNIKVKSI
ncbi:MAG TPA: Hsp20/alpha crystallin family protein [Candidatus Paceibacterota bacterium]|nr:Hsp20/alpha crystallin family protein [Candidatus Paceibacterota bacterium]